MKKWQVLLVDDEQDVHSITGLILKKKRWRRIPFELTSAYSQAEAMEILQNQRDFHVALVDVVMEKDSSGLELCEYIRKHCPSSMRIVLRTGQPGLAPEENILNEYDIDYYLAKSDATPAKLYSVIRACLRSSQDISTLLAYGQQLQSFTKTLQDVSNVSDLLVFMREALNFLEAKHSTLTVFNYDVSNFLESFIADDVTMETGEHLDFLRIGKAIVEAHERNLELLEAHPAAELGLSDSFFVIPFEAQEERQGENAISQEDAVKGGLAFRMEPELLTEKTKADFLADAVLFMDNWRIAYATVRLRERLSQEQLLRDQMYYERMESIATMVTGVAHELNTPLGVAKTASNMVTEIARNLLDAPPEDEEDAKELADDLEDSCQLLERNLDRAQTLIKSFKQLSSSQLSDEKIEIELGELASDCLETMRPDLKKHGIAPEVHRQEDTDLTWNGYPGHLSQVIINLVQNTIRYAYPEDKRDGSIDIFLKRPDPERFVIEYVDYGKGVDPEILPRLFDAFVTSGRSQGGTGLGMAISRNIVVEILGGSITCDSSPGKGAKFTINLPSEVNVDANDIRRMALKKI